MPLTLSRVLGENAARIKGYARDMTLGGFLAAPRRASGLTETKESADRRVVLSWAIKPYHDDDLVE